MTLELSPAELLEFRDNLNLIGMALAEWIYGTDDGDMVEGAYRLLRDKKLKFTPQRELYSLGPTGKYGMLEYEHRYDVEPELAGQYICYFLFGDYTSKAGLSAKSNQEQYDKAMEACDDDNYFYRTHAYYAVDLCIRVWDGNFRITDAFKAFWKLYEIERAEYIINETHFYNLEWATSIENTASNIRSVDGRKNFWLDSTKVPMTEKDGKQVYDYDKMAADVLNYMREHDSEPVFRNQAESVDDQGAWPKDEAIIAALLALGLGAIEAEES